MGVLFRFDEPDPEDAIVRYLIDLPGVFLPHSGVTLFHHLLGTYRILKAWGCENDLCLAGLFHSIYGTPAYPNGPLPESRRVELSGVIGTRAEEFVYQFSRTNWPCVFASGDDTLHTLPPSLVMLATANIVEQSGRIAQNNPKDRSIRESLEQFALLIPHLTPAAAQCLTLELQQVRDGLRGSA
jgi:hypothetical protein